MKLLRLDLKAVGTFTDVSLDLSAGDAGLHVVVGPNEAGKSTALRAVAALLFGFGQRTAGENAVHDAGDVRVGGLLRHSDGTELAIVRRRGKEKTLLDGADGRTPLRDDALAKFLGAVDRATFDSFFGLGHESLRQGGEELLRSDGEIGQALFSAGAGGKPLRVALDRYVKQAGEVYVRNGKSQELPAALARLEAATQAIRAASLPPEQWTAERRDRDDADAEAAAAGAELAAVRAEQVRVDRIQRAIPVLAERATLRAELSSVADAPLLPADFAARRAAAEQARSNHARALADARRRVAALAAELGAIVVPEALVAQADAVNDLFARLKTFRQATATMPALRVKLDAAIATAARIVEDLRPGQPAHTEADGVLAAADGLRLGTARRHQITELAAAFERLTERQASARRAVSDADAERRRQQAERAALPAAVDVSSLDAAVRAAMKAGDLDKELANGRAAAARETARADAALRGLPLVAGSLADVEALPVPSTPSVEQAARDQSKAEAEHARIAAEVARVQTQAAELGRQLGELQLAGHVPSEEELAQARADRDALWAEHRAAGTIGDARPFEVAVRHADDVADGLRRESARVARQAQLTFVRREADRSLAAVTEQLAVAEMERAAARSRWGHLWQPAGIEPLPPVEMRDWLTRHAEVRRAAELVRHATATVASLAEQRSAHRAAVSAALGEPATEGTLAPLLVRAQGVVDAAKSVDTSRQQVEALLRAGAADADRRAHEVASADAALVAWQAEWSEAVAGLGLPVGAGPGQARSIVQRCVDLAAAADDVRRIRTDLATAQVEAERFTVDAHRLAEAVGMDHAGPADGTATRLRQAVEAAQQLATRRAELQKQRAAVTSDVSKAESAEAAAMAELAELCRVARCDGPEGLPEVERRSAERRELEGKLRQKEHELHTINHGEPTEGLAAEAAATDTVALERRAAELAARSATLAARGRELDQQIGRASANLARWTGDDDTAADAANQAQIVLAQAREAVGRYLRSQLAAGVLRLGIERHRKRKQAPLLRRASELFAALTLGSFASLDVDFNDGDQPVLVGVRAGGGRRPKVDQMSDGTRDQLYLSLRLAALEDFVARNEPVPLVVDDVLVHFDDGRSAAALAALGELSRRTQVILFTHHARVAELAALAAGDAAVVHRLGA